MNNKLRTAFTLIELLVVIAIIGILSGLIIVGMSEMTDNASLAKSKVFAASLRDSLLANLADEWKLDGNATDSWGLNNGTITGAATSSSDCVYDSCISFDGNGDYIDFGSDPSLVNIFNSGSIFTYAVWLYPTAWPPSAWHWIICKAFTSHISPYYQVELRLSTAGRAQSNIYNNAAGAYIPVAQSPSGSISLNKWHFIAVSIDLSANTQKMYLDGVLVGSGSGATGTYTNYASALAAGANKNLYSSSTYNFTGKMDEIRLYTAAVPSSQIKESYYAGINNLLSRGGITEEEYHERIGGLINNLAKN